MIIFKMVGWFFIIFFILAFIFTFIIACLIISSELEEIENKKK